MPHTTTSDSGQIRRAIEAYELWKSLYPRDSSPYNNLAIEYLALGEPQKAGPAALIAAQLDGGSSLAEAALARVYLETNERARLRSLCDEKEGQKGDSAMLRASCFLLAFLESDESRMKQQIQGVQGNAAESELLDDVAWVAMYQGKLGSARKLFAQSRREAMTQGFSELAATIDVDEATLEADLGYPEEAHALSLDALRLAPDNPSIQAMAALALARSGDTARAASEAAKAATLAPHDTILNEAELPAVRAAILLRAQKFGAVLQALESSRPYDQCSALALAPAYYRGLAYQESGSPDKASIEYRSVLAHRALAPDSPYIPLAALQLSRALRASGDLAGASRVELDLQSIWGKADPDFTAHRYRAAALGPRHANQNRH